MLPGVQEVHRITSPYKLAGRSFRPEGTIVKFANGIEIGGKKIVVMAGPCSVESREQLFTVAELIAKAGARVLRGGAFKPRSSPYSFQGLGVDALKLLREAGDQFKLLVISEVMEISQIELMLPYVDIFQVGARNMQNFNLLRELGKVRKAGAAQARHRGHARRAAVLRGIPARRRQLRNHSVRARHPYF